MFYSSAGPLTLNILPTDEERKVNAPKSQFSEAWLADDASDIINYETPVVFDGGLFYVGVIIAFIKTYIPDVE